MLSNAVTNQLMNWTVKTDAMGDEQCVTLLIAEFHFQTPDEAPRPMAVQPKVPGILRISMEEEVIVMSDPRAMIIGNPFRTFACKVRRLTKRLFHGTG